MTIVCTTKQFFTDKRHHTINVAPGHQDFINSMTTGTLQMGTALVMVLADGSFATAIAKDNHKEGEIQGRIREHSRLIKTLRVRQTRIGVNRMECGAAGCKQERYFETSNEMRSVLIKIGSNGFDHRPWPKSCIRKLRQGPDTQASL